MMLRRGGLTPDLPVASPPTGPRSCRPPRPKGCRRDLIGAWLDAPRECCPPAIRQTQRWRITVIVVGVDAHKDTHTAAALDALTAAQRASRTVAAREHGHRDLLAWAAGVDRERV